MKRKFLRAVFGTLSFSTALFAFQACYGTPHDFGQDVYIEGIVKAKSTNNPIPGIKVSIEDQPQYEYTDIDGRFKIYANRSSEYKLHFIDIDSTINSSYLPKDTVISIIDKSAFLNILLNEK